jgi:hypothetical protein
MSSVGPGGQLKDSLEGQEDRRLIVDSRRSRAQIHWYQIKGLDVKQLIYCGHRDSWSDSSLLKH